jgi:hypothetical protein
VGCKLTPPARLLNQLQMLEELSEQSRRRHELAAPSPPNLQRLIMAVASHHAPPH